MKVFELTSNILGTNCRLCAVFGTKMQPVERKIGNLRKNNPQYIFTEITPATKYKYGYVLVFERKLNRKYQREKSRHLYIDKIVNR